MLRILPIIFSLALLPLGCSARHEHVLTRDVVSHIPADGREHRIATLLGRQIEDLRISGVISWKVRIDSVDGDQSTLYLRTPVQPGVLAISLTGQSTHLRLPLTLTSDDVATADGAPDWMRLHTAEDRRAFRDWFTELADRAADAPPNQLPTEITDCASFIRYAYHEALRLHDDRWYAQFPVGAMPALPSVQQWSYPNTPLGANLFRTRPGPFHPTDLSDGTFTQFADAKTLHFDNAFLLGRDLRSARPGDLIFYRVLETNSQYHSMIITGEHGEWVVYNTGPDHGHHGEMRRVLLADLLHHPDPQWRPEAANPNWLGVYRWNILQED